MAIPRPLSQERSTRAYSPPTTPSLIPAGEAEAPEAASAQTSDGFEIGGGAGPLRPAAAPASGDARLADEARQRLLHQRAIFRRPGAQVTLASATPGEAAPVSKTSAPTPPNRTAAEVKDLFHNKVFPSVKKALAAAGRSNDSTQCEKGAALTKYALDQLGVGGSRITTSNGHSFVEVETKDGQTLILDPTNAQFWRDGSPTDAEMNRRGFAGTREELFKKMEDRVEDLGFAGGFLPETVRMFKGEQSIPEEDRSAWITEQLNPFYDAFDHTKAYFNGPTDRPLKNMAEAELAFGYSDRKGSLMSRRPDGIENMVIKWKDVDIGPEIRTMFDALDRELQRYR